MPRINVEEKALTDPRFRLAGAALDPLQRASRELVEQSVGMFLCMRVWAVAVERGTDRLPVVWVEAIHEGLVDALVGADLLERVGDGGMVRVRGFADAGGAWLAQRRAAAPAGGRSRAASARRDKTGQFCRNDPAGASRKPAGQIPAGPAGTSAPAPALTPESCPSPVSSPSPLLNHTLSGPERPDRVRESDPGGNGAGPGPDPLHGFRGWWELWREVCAVQHASPGPKNKAADQWRRHRLAAYVPGIMARTQAWLDAQIEFVEAREFIQRPPHGVRWLRDKRWLEEVPTLCDD